MIGECPRKLDRYSILELFISTLQAVCQKTRNFLWLASECPHRHANMVKMYKTPSGITVRNRVQMEKTRTEIASSADNRTVIQLG